jgi:hypothetical protein
MGIIQTVEVMNPAGVSGKKKGIFERQNYRACNEQ